MLGLSLCLKAEVYRLSYAAQALGLVVPCGLLTSLEFLPGAETSCTLLMR